MRILLTNKYTLWILGELLWLANSEPPWWRSEFYKIKEKLLEDYGTFWGYHLQHIVKHCFRCDGTGKKRNEATIAGVETVWYGGTCPRCYGSGKFEEFWSMLRFYRLGRRSFHTPVKKYYSRESIPRMNFLETIEGYVGHQLPKYYLYREAAYWLALIFDRKVFFKHFGKAGHPSRKFTPLVILGNWVFTIRHIPYTVKRKIDHYKFLIKAFRQNRCQHDFPWTEEPSDYDECRRCGLERMYVDGFQEVEF